MKTKIKISTKKPTAKFKKLKDFKKQDGRLIPDKKNLSDNIKNDDRGVSLSPLSDLIELKPFSEFSLIKKCPYCNKRLRKSWVNKDNDGIVQILRCMRKKCDKYYNEVKIKL